MDQEGYMKRSNKPARGGDILGLGGADAAIVNSDHRSSKESDSVRRHKRMNEGADEMVPSTESGEPQSGHGQASVDMGGGGDGTDVD
jgi:hypothetical protein